MGSVTDEYDASLGADPRWEWVAEYEFPVYEVFFGGCTDDGMADGGPVGDCCYSIVDVAWCGPALLYICFVLHENQTLVVSWLGQTYLVC
jgi:hypothetical protein